MMVWGVRRCGGNNRRENVDYQSPSAPAVQDSLSCLDRPLLQPIMVIEKKLCKEVLAEVSFLWIYHVEMYTAAPYFHVKEACKACCLKESFVSAFLVTKKVFGAKISGVMYYTSKAVKRLLTAL